MKPRKSRPVGETPRVPATPAVQPSSPPVRRRFDSVTLGWAVAGIIVGFGAEYVVARTRREGTHDTSATAARETPHTMSGPWGEITVTPIELPPPSARLASELCSGPSVAWQLPADRVPSLLVRIRAGAGATPMAAQHALESAIDCSAGAVCTFAPGRALYVDVPRDVRNGIQAFLRQQTPVHSVMRWATPPAGKSWDEVTTLPANVRALIDRETWGPHAQRFSDWEGLCAAVPDEAGRRAVLATVFRRGSLLARVHVAPDADVETLVHYWRGSRDEGALRAMFEGLRSQPGGGTIDLAELLPDLVRERLHTFARADESTTQRDCLWTAVNFFDHDGPARSIDSPREFSDYLDANFREVAQGSRTFGDVVILTTANGRFVHSMRQIAGDVVFTKNGADWTEPWALAAFATVREEYPDSVSVHVYRRTDTP